MYQTFEEMGLDEGIIRGLTANGVTIHMINAKLTQHQAVIRNSGISVPDFIADAYYLLLKYGKQAVNEPLPFDVIEA